MALIEDFAKQERDVLREELPPEEKGSTVREILKNRRSPIFLASIFHVLGAMNFLKN